MTAMGGTFSAAALASSQGSEPQFAVIKGSVLASTNSPTGQYHAARMSVEVALAPRNQAGLMRQLEAIYTRHSGQYDKFLVKGQFDARYAPTGAERQRVASYLRSTGLSLEPASSPFLVRASGSSQRVETAFRTRLSTYAGARGTHYFANSTAVQLPASLSGGVLGVIGLTNTVREHSMLAGRPGTAADSQPAASVSPPGCDVPYPTTAKLFDLANSGAFEFPTGYGASPGCSGLSPSQTNSIYDAPHVGPRGQGAGVTIGVYELSAYLRSDVDTFVHTFYGPRYAPHLTNIDVDGGTLHPRCPVGDPCDPAFNGYDGDGEVDADIDMDLTIAPDVSRVLVYEAPYDLTGQTELDNYVAIANQDTAASVSSSWASCEDFLGAAYVQAENVAFEQLAMQGQSMFSASGDTGPFECITSNGATNVNALDPAVQPWVTGTGGTSLESDNPGINPRPPYPAGAETIWNEHNLCNTSAPSPANDNQGGMFWCELTGAGGGNISEFWGQPFYQHGRGVINSYTSYGNGTTQCALAAAGTPCREVPDVSADADPWTGYPEYCTGNPNPPDYSGCGAYSGSQPVPGWFEEGGTSLTGPLWAAIAADRDSYTGHRSGNLNPLLYYLFNTDPRRYFHDITGVGPLQQAATSNGLYPTTPGYDLATGIGTPKMAALITETG